MLNATQKDMVRDDFEKFFKSLRGTNRGLDFDLFGVYAASIINFYSGSSLLNPSERADAALFLCKLFNAGLNNVISDADLKTIADAINQDPTLDYSVLNPIFS